MAKGSIPAVSMPRPRLPCAHFGYGLYGHTGVMGLWVICITERLQVHLKAMSSSPFMACGGGAGRGLLGWAGLQMGGAIIIHTASVL